MFPLAFVEAPRGYYSRFYRDLACTHVFGTIGSVERERSLSPSAVVGCSLRMGVGFCGDSCEDLPTGHNAQIVFHTRARCISKIRSVPLCIRAISADAAATMDTPAPRSAGNPTRAGQGADPVEQKRESSGGLLHLAARKALECHPLGPLRTV